ncbi:TPA: hypothetical protein HA372_04115 [Candidatus Woesearchaeota archaeon]|nr:hypothetical protein [Candidatus Woesearchaeota archaeon]HII65904.1 hypothetical protein [Candidatus Woesearchaeota archaeon]HIJ18844.1 hypothetical protein [Candidatus Woesearchaeota archaeon]
MKETIKRSLLVGIGLAAVTKPKVEKVLREFQKAGLIGTAQARDILSTVLREAKRQQKAVERHLRSRAEPWKRKADALAKKLEARGRAEVKKATRRMEREVR